MNSEGEQGESEVPDANEAKQFWTDMWSTEVEHNREAEWLEDFKTKMNAGPRQAEVNVTGEKIKKVLKKVPNWKAPGPDGVQGFWLKNLQQCIDIWRNISLNAWKDRHHHG